MSTKLSRTIEVSSNHRKITAGINLRVLGYVNTTGSWVIEPTFSYAGSFWYGLARVAWKDGDYGYTDKTGRSVWRYDPSGGTVK